MKVGGADRTVTTDDDDDDGDTLVGTLFKCFQL